MKKGLFLVASAVCAMGLFSCATTEGAARKENDVAPSKQTIKGASAGDLLEGFEDDGVEDLWRAVGNNWNDGDVSSCVEVTTDWCSEGKKSLKCQFNDTGSNGGAATFFTEAPAFVDFSAYKTLSFDVKNPLTVPVQVACAICTGDSWDWHESKCFDIQPGENFGIKVSMFTNELKAGKSNWEFKLNLSDPDDVRRVAFKFILPAKIDGVMYIDNIRLE